MSELKPCPCPICGAELKIYGPEDWYPTFYDPDSGGDPYNAVCDCGFQYSNGSYDYSEFIACLNRRAQPADVETVRHGKWLSVCGCIVRRDLCRNESAGETNYCPNCGAKMDKEDEI